MKKIYTVLIISMVLVTGCRKKRETESQHPQHEPERGASNVRLESRLQDMTRPLPFFWNTATYYEGRAKDSEEVQMRIFEETRVVLIKASPNKDILQSLGLTNYYKDFWIAADIESAEAPEKSMFAYVVVELFNSWIDPESVRQSGLESTLPISELADLYIWRTFTRLVGNPQKFKERTLYIVCDVRGLAPTPCGMIRRDRLFVGKSKFIELLGQPHLRQAVFRKFAEVSGDRWVGADPAQVVEDVVECYEYYRDTRQIGKHVE